MDSMQAENNSICQICGSTGAQIHYRARACGSCKVFFIRAVRRPIPFVCDNNGTCNVAKDSRNSCKACRFMRCLQANMTEEDVGRLKKSSRTHNTSVVPYLSAAEMEVKLNELYGAASIGIHFVRELEKTSKALDYARTLAYIEKLCENSEASRSNFDYSLDISLAEALENPHLCCARTPLAICSTNYCGVVLFTLVYNAYLTNCHGMLFPHGFKYSLSLKKEDHEFNDFLQTLVDYLHRHVVRVFRETEIKAEEYSFLKALILFSGVIPLTDAGYDVVLKARRKYAALLSEFITTTRKDLTSDEQMSRLTRLFTTVPHMMHASEFDNVYCGKMVMMNMGNLSGTLSYDLHIRKF